MFYNIYLQVLSKQGKLASGLPENLPSPPLDAIILHPVREPKEFFQLSNMHRFNLRPLQTQVAPYTNEKFIYRTACVHNVVSQILTMCPHNKTLKNCPWNTMKECPSPSPSTVALQAMANAWQVHISMFTFAVLRDEQDEELSLHCLNNELKGHGILPERLPLWLPHRNEPSLKSSISSTFGKELSAFRYIFARALELGVQRVMVMQGRVLAHRQFSERMSLVLSDPRCGGHLFTEDQGGVLVLTPLSEKPSEEVSNLLQEDRDQTGSLCYNAPYNITSAMAAIYHQSTFSAIIKFIDTGFSQIQSLQEVIVHLIKKGYIVRVASPQIFTHPMLPTFDEDVSNQDEFPCRCGLCSS